MGAVQDRRRRQQAGRVRVGVFGLTIGLLCAGAALAPDAYASEDAASIYLLGSGGPGAAVMPPLKGVFLQNIFYDYQGSASASRTFEFGGNLVAGVNASVPADFPTLAWVPTTDLLGGTVALAGILPFGAESVDVGAIFTGPLGREVALSKHDSTFVVGDPLMTGAWGWKTGDLHLQLSSFVNIPIGNYRDGALANLAFHRWAGDTSFAATWHDDKRGWDISGKAGLTFNGTNNVTQYTTGTEFHLEGSVQKILSKTFSLALQTYYFQQVTPDGGAGDRVGPFKGRVVGVGGQGTYNFMIGKAPIALGLQGMTEFAAQNRLEGRAIFVNLSMPLWVQLPKAPHD